MKIPGYFLVAMLLVVGVEAARAADVVQTGKRATALVEIGELGSGSAFCINADGLFVTNRHVAAALPKGQHLKVVVNPTEEGQHVYDAEVVAISTQYDLALLRVKEARNLPVVVLGDDKTLKETQAITAFGYPYGKMLAVNLTDYPSVSVNTGKITSLRRENGKLMAIQVDALVNPGNSGGPVLDAAGKVVGIIVSGVQNFFGPSGINFAIPVSHLREFLDVPHLMVTVPKITYADRFAAAAFTCDVVWAAGSKTGIRVELELESAGAAVRKLAMSRKIDGTYQATAAPIVKSTNPSPMLAASTLTEKGLASGWIADHPIHVGGQTIELNKVKSIERIPAPAVKTIDGQTIEGEPSDLGQLNVVAEEGAAAKPMDLKSAFHTEIDTSAASDSSVRYHAIARQNEKIVARADGTIHFDPNGGDDSAAVVETVATTLAPTKDTQLQTLRLPKGIDVSELGGSGSLLVVHSSAWRLLAVIDLRSQTVLHCIPIDADKVVAAAGANDLVVFVPDTRELRRYDLRSGRLLLTSKFEPNFRVDEMEMGPCSTGPLLIKTGNNLKWFYDVPTLRHMQINWGDISPDFAHYRASSDGSKFAGSFNGGVYRLHAWGNNVTGRWLRHNDGDIYPNFDASLLLGVPSVLGPDLSVVLKDETPHRFISTWSPGLFARLAYDLKDGRFSISGDVYNASEKKLVCALPPLPEMEIEMEKGVGASLWIDQRLMFFPADNAIVAVPMSDDRVTFRKFDFSQAIAKNPTDKSMYVRTQPPMQFVEGEEYSYALQVGGGKTPLRYHLDLCPKGMKVAENGRVTWTVPATVSSDELPVVLNITDAGGAHLVHRFALQVERNAPGRCPRLRVDGSAISQSTRQQFDKLAAAFGHGGDDSNTSSKLIELCLLDLDAPEFTAPYRAKAPAELVKMIDLALKPFSELSQDDAAALGEWFFDHSKSAAGDARQTALRNAWLYWNQWILLHEAEDSAKSEMQKKAMAIAAPFGIDLLKALRNEDVFAMQGTWKADDQGLLDEGDAANARVQLPTRTTGSYRLHVEFTADSGPEADIMLPMGDSEGLLVMGGWEGHAALANLPNQRPVHSKFADFMMEPNRRYSIDVLVGIRDDQVSFVAYKDGAMLTSWKGKQSDVRLPPVWQMPMKGSFGFGSTKVRTRFHVATLYPLSRDMFVRTHEDMKQKPPMGAKTYLTELAGDSKTPGSAAGPGLPDLSIAMKSGDVAAWSIGKGYTRFEATIGPDSNAASLSVMGDGRELWKGAAQKGVGDKPVSIDLRNVDRLELRCAGADGHGAWIFPHLIGLDEAPRVSPDAPIWKQAATAAQNHSATASQLVGNRTGKSFTDFPAGGGLLVGVRLSIDLDQNDWHIQSIQGIYLKPDGTRVLGERHGEVGRSVEEWIAPPGYVISGFHAAGQSMVDGFNCTCVRLTEKGPDPEDIDDKTMWHGRAKPRGPKRLLGTAGKPVVGLTGRINGGLQAIGVYSAQ